MSCRNVQRLAADFILGDLASDEARAIRRHLDTCRACSEEVDSMRAIMELAREDTLPDPGPSFWESFPGETYQRFEQERRGREGETKWGAGSILARLAPSRWGWFPLGFGSAVAAALLCLVVYGGLKDHQGPSTVLSLDEELALVDYMEEETRLYTMLQDESEIESSDWIVAEIPSEALEALEALDAMGKIAYFTASEQSLYAELEKLDPEAVEKVVRSLEERYPQRPTTSRGKDETNRMAA